MYPSELEYDNSSLLKWESKRSSVASTVKYSQSNFEDSKHVTETNQNQTYLSFSSKNENNVKTIDNKKAKTDNANSANIADFQIWDLKENIYSDEIGIEWDSKDRKLAEKITPIKSNYFNNKIHWPPNWVNSNDKKENASKEGKHK